MGGARQQSSGEPVRVWRLVARSTVHGILSAGLSNALYSAISRLLPKLHGDKEIERADC